MTYFECTNKNGLISICGIETQLILFILYQFHLFKHFINMKNEIRNQCHQAQ